MHSNLWVFLAGELGINFAKYKPECLNWKGKIGKIHEDNLPLGTRDTKQTFVRKKVHELIKHELFYCLNEDEFNGVHANMSKKNKENPRKNCE